jgi:septin 7
LDIQFMKQLDNRVNIVPIIAKADTMTPEERQAFKETVAREIRENNIRIYQFPEGKADQKQFTDRAPFAVIGSNHVIEKVAGRSVRGRKYSWGVVELDNLEHNDFAAVRHLIIETHMIDLIQVTAFVHYENFRTRQFTTLEKEQMRLLKEKQDKEFHEMFASREAKIAALEQELGTNQSAYERSLSERRRRLKELLEERKRAQGALEEVAGSSKGFDLKKFESEKALSETSFGSKGSRKSKSGTLTSVFRGKGGDH